MKFLLVSFICCIIFGKSLSNNVEEVDDFKILKGDYGVQDDETMRAFVHPGLLEMDGIFWNFFQLVQVF